MPRRRRDDDDDDEFDDRDRDDEPQFPGSVRAAGIIWIVLGVVFLFSSCLSYFVFPILLRVGNGDNRPGKFAPSAGEVCALWLGIGIAVALLVFGILTIRGSARDTLAASVLSLVVGGLYLLAGVAGVLVGLSGPNALWPVGVLAAALGGLCILPGVLGLMGRKRYLKWRSETDPRPRRRREWEEDEEEDEWHRQRRRRKGQPFIPMVTVDCPRCFQSVKVPEESVGGVCPCPRCGNEIDVPTVE